MIFSIFGARTNSYLSMYFNQKNNKVGERVKVPPSFHSNMNWYAATYHFF